MALSPVGTKKLAGFRYAKFVVIESLGPADVSTGTELAQYVSTLDSFEAQQLPLQIFDCRSVSDFKLLLANLTQDAAENGVFPILHVECHGSNSGSGLILSNGDEVVWDDLSQMLKALNIASQFNLLVFFAACNAFYFIEQMTSMHPSPVYAVVAPSDEVDPAEVMRGTRIYYRKLFESGDAGIALHFLRAETLTLGSWFGQSAEEWFENVLVNYVNSHCSTRSIAERARVLYQKQSATDVRVSIGKIKRGIKLRHKHFVEGYFQQCFCTVELPNNLLRFDGLRKRVELKVRTILSSPGFRS